MNKHNKSKMYVDVVSLHSEVTGSCNLCTVKLPNGEKVKFLVDCGLFQEEKYEKRNYSFPFDPKEIDFVLVTHSHIDHIGRIPKLYKDGFNKLTYASVITTDLMPIALNNTAEIMESAFKRNSRKAKNIQLDSSIPLLSGFKKEPLFTKKDVDAMYSVLYGAEYNKKFQITPNITATFLQNGHLLGSASILIKISYRKEDPIYLLFSGDYSKENMVFNVEEMSKSILNLPVNVIQESTYGTTSKQLIKKCFEDNIIASVNNKETIIIPVFSLGRAQEILFVLSKLQRDGLLFKDIPIYLDGKLAISYTNYYSNNLNILKEEMKYFKPHNLKEVEDFECRNRLLTDRNTKIIVTTSGMGSYGPAQAYIPAYISSPKCTIHFTGYTTPDTLGSYLKGIPEGEAFNLNGIMVKKKAKVLFTNEFSGHAKKEDLLDYLLQFKELKSVLVNHGNRDIKEAYAKEVIEQVNPKDVAILSPENYIRIDPYGIVKSFPASELKEYINL